MTDFVDIIIPVYNTEMYLPRCIDSILQQTHVDWQLILVDDGSTDSSGKICDEYASKDTRIKVIHKKNEGVSIARNIGLEHSNNPFITFIDSDDYISCYYLTNLLKPLTEDSRIDISISGCYVDYDERMKDCGLNEKTIKVDEFSFNAIPSDSYYALFVVWGTMFRRAIIENANLKFTEHLRRDEDFIFKLSYLNKSKNVKLIGDVDYYHTDREDSLVKKQLDYAQAKLDYEKLLDTCLQISNKSSKYFNFVKHETQTRFERLVKAICTSYSGKQRIELLKYLDSDFFKKYHHADNWKNYILDYLLTHKFFNLYCFLIDQVYKKSNNA